MFEGWNGSGKDGMKRGNEKDEERGQYEEEDVSERDEDDEDDLRWKRAKE